MGSVRVVRVKPIHMFGPLKRVLGGDRFRSDKDFQARVMQWFHQQFKNFFAVGPISKHVSKMPTSVSMG
jgi:hypothetical protein